MRWNLSKLLDTIYQGSFTPLESIAWKKKKKKNIFFFKLLVRELTKKLIILNVKNSKGKIFKYHSLDLYLETRLCWRQSEELGTNWEWFPAHFTEDIIPKLSWCSLLLKYLKSPS
jgi:hypothetical protein